MFPTDSIYTVNMNDQQRAWFYVEYERAHKDEVIGLLFALFLGTFGVHHFYLRRDALGILYLIFFWTGIPALLGFIECFFMPGRVRQYNAAQAYLISSHILNGGITVAGSPTPDSRTWTPPATTNLTRCSGCGNSLDMAATFCPHCGAAVAHTALSTQPAL